MASEKYTIRQFEKAWLYKDFSEISEHDFELVYEEYVDITGAYISQQFDKAVYIRFLANRINTISNFIKLQILFFEEFKQPYVEKFSIVEDFGYNLEWNGSKEDFLKQLENMQDSESWVDSDLKIAVKELEDLKKEEKTEVQSDKEKVKNWMNCVNSLVKVGYSIDKDKMTVQELSFIIKYEKDQIQKNGR